MASGHIKLFYLVAATFALSGCNATMSEYCQEESQHPYQDGIASLIPYKDAVPYAMLPSAKKAERSIASLNSDTSKPGSIAVLPWGDRDRWMKWSESELKKVEAAIDWLNDHRENVSSEKQVRHGLSEAADEFVAFNGYTQQGRVDRMIETLGKLEAIRRSQIALACNAP